MWVQHVARAVRAASLWEPRPTTAKAAAKSSCFQLRLGSGRWSGRGWSPGGSTGWSSNSAGLALATSRRAATALASPRTRRGQPELDAGDGLDNDILEDVQPEDFGEAADWEEPEDMPVGGPDRQQNGRAGPLARKMFNCARIGVRSEEVWARFSQRVLATTALIGAGDVALIFFAYARIKYRDMKTLDALSPFLLRHIDQFSTTELVLLMNAHKKLEHERLDSLQLLLSAVSSRRSEWTGRHVALAANTVAYFYIYQPSFWRQVAMALPKLLWTMNPLELSNLVSAMARIDLRDGKALIMVARMCRRCAARHLFSQETLAVTMNAFAKLDFNHPKLAKVFEDATVVKLDRALALGPDYRKSSLRDADVFDVQALVLVLHTLVCFVGTSDGVIEKLLTLLSWSKDEVSDYQRRVLKTTCIVLRHKHGPLVRRLNREVKAALYVFEKSPCKVATTESRWVTELRNTLRKMDIVVEMKPLVDDQVLDIWLPTSKAVVCAVGPYGYYSSSTNRTAYSKLHQRLLEMQGHTCITVPYYEWSELRTEEDKMVYLWSMGRRAAAREKDEESEVAPAVVVEDLQSDLSDVMDTRP